MIIDSMPSHQAMHEFSSRLASRLSIELLAERKDSKVVLLGEKGTRLRISD
jgi:wyosine [tRNA(Phe)-imidazoG37] synthetase (radical SAM superfamily)